MEQGVNQKVATLYKSGLSMHQISDLVGLSISRVRYSLKKQSIPRRNHRHASRMLHFTKFGKKQCQIKSSLSMKEKDLRIAGIMLYWGEGTKQGNSVVFSNSDPDMVKLFLRFMRELCGIEEERLRILLHAYKDQNENQLKLFWSKITKIPIEQFSKTYIHYGDRGTYRTVSEHGTVSLRYSDTELLNIINNWINEYRMPM